MPWNLSFQREGGYQLGANGRSVEPLEAEQATLRAIRERRAGGDSLQAIANYLNGLGAQTRAGSPWRFEYVRSVLNRAA